MVAQGGNMGAIRQLPSQVQEPPLGGGGQAAAAHVVPGFPGILQQNGNSRRFRYIAYTKQALGQFAASACLLAILFVL